MKNETKSTDGPNLAHENDRLAKLWPHLTDMSPDELRDYVRQVRSDRRVRKASPTKQKAERKKTDTKAARLKKMAQSDPALMAKLLKELGDGNED